MSAALPEKWVQSIFAKLAVRYGQRFLRRWDGVDIAAVHADWAEQLARFHQRPDCIKYALDNLPTEKPPTLGEFKVLCNSAPEPKAAQLPAPKADPVKVAQELAKLARPDPSHPKAWAHRIVERHASGAVINPWALRIAREVAQCGS